MLFPRAASTVQSVPDIEKSILLYVKGTVLQYRWNKTFVEVVVDLQFETGLV